MITSVELALRLREQLHTEALRAYPRECCGLLEGILTLSLSKGEPESNETLRVTAIHPMPNLAQEAYRFEIDPSAHITLLRELRGTGRNIIGCYHSHPNGRAEPSERDRESAAEEDFLWLIVAGSAREHVAAFASTGKILRPIEIRWT